MMLGRVGLCCCVYDVFMRGKYNKVCSVASELELSKQVLSLHHKPIMPPPTFYQDTRWKMRDMLPILKASTTRLLLLQAAVC